MPDTCPRCGAPLVNLADLAEAALVARTALEGMKLVVPDKLKRSLALLARALPCGAGTCEPLDPAPR